MIVAVMTTALAGTVKAQSDYSSDYTGNVTLSTAGGTSASTCKISISNIQYDGIKAGTSSKSGAVKITVPTSTKYLHLHMSAWNGETGTILTVTPTGYSGNITLTANSGISGNSPFTFSGSANTSDYYKVITFASALTEDVSLTFTSQNKRFVVWGVTAEEESGTPTCEMPTFSPAAGVYTSAQNVTISAEAGATIYYTTDGSTPSASSTQYSGAISVSSTTTIKAIATKSGSNDSQVASATYVITQHTGTAASPYTVAEARALIDAGVGTQDVYATGIVSGIPTAWSSDHNNITFNFVDAEGDTDFLQAYRCESTDAADASTVAVGDIVVVKGNLIKYNDTYEFGQGCTLVSLEHPVVPTIIVSTASLSEFTYEEGNGPSDAKTFTVSGENLTTDIELSLNGDYEMSLTEDGTYSSSLTLTQTSGAVERTTVYVRLKAGLDADDYEGTITLTSTDATTQTVSLSGSVTEPEAPHVTWDLSTNSYVSATDDLVTWTSDYVVMTNAKGSSSTNPNNYLGGDSNNRTSTRMYTGNVLTITPAAGYSIISVVFEATTNGYASALKNSTWTNATAAMEDGDNVKTVTVTPTSGNKAISATIGGTCGFTSVKVYYEEDNTPVIPVITANNDNIEIEYDATSGSIAYSVTNPVTGGAVTATSSESWLTVGAISSETIAFTCEANTGDARTATVTLTYTYNTTETVTTSVIVTQAAYVAPVTSDWVATSLADLTADDVFVIVGNNGDTFAMSNNNGTTDAPTAVAVTVSGNYITSQVPETIRWTISGNATNGYTFYPNGDTEKWLYCNNSNNGVRVGTNDNKTFTVDNGYLKHAGTSRYVGIYDSQDWRCYTNTTGNIADQTFTFYKYVGAPLPAITAEDVEIAYNVTSGSISYEVENSVTGGTLTASTEDTDTWLNLGDVAATAVPFTASANDNPVARTASVTLTYTYGTETTTKTITVTQTGNPDANGGANNPYTVTEALAVINSLADGGRTGKVYVTGTITAIDEVETAEHFNATYTISDDTNNLLVYRGFYLNNAHFASKDQIKVGDNVVIYGQLLKFVKDDVTTPEIAQGNYIVSQTNNNTPTSITLNGSGYATFASTSAVDFDNTTGCTAWAVTAVSGTEITFSQITGTVAAGTGVLLKGEPNATVTFSYATSAGSAVSGNLLEGITEETYVMNEEYFGLKGAKFVKVAAGNVPAGRALLPASVVEPSGVNAFTFSFDEDATAIKAIDNGQLTTDGVIYNVAGQRLSKMQKGINIVNGRKVLY